MYVIRFNQSRSDWRAMETIQARCENAKEAGAIKEWSVHQDHLNNVALYEISFP
jgi:hypothetical protein